jgi:hypothetical protein
MKLRLLIAICVLLIPACDFAADQNDVQKFFSKNKISGSPDYAFVKYGIGGSPDHLATIHGYLDDKKVCEELAKEYNDDSSLSVLPGKYGCIQLNE